jgi:hypothetical protein
MAIKKTFELQCEGPCKRQHTASTVPITWARLKLSSAGTPDGNYFVCLLCPECKAKVMEMLENEWYKFTTVSANAQKKEGE